MTRQTTTPDFETQPHLVIAAFKLLATDPTFLTVFRPILNGEHWPEPEAAWLLDEIVEHSDTYHAPPGLNGLQMRLDATAGMPDDRKKVIGLLLKRMDEVAPTPTEADYIRDNFELVIRHRAILAAVKTSFALLTEGREEDVYDIIEQTNLVRLVDDDWMIVNEAIKHYAEMFAADVLEGVTTPTGLRGLDSKIGGGIRPKELGVWLGSTGTGKSMALVQMGVEAMRHGKTVLHVTFENTREETIARYVHHLLNIDSQDMVNMREDDPVYLAALTAFVDEDNSKCYVKEMVGEDTSTNEIAVVLTRLQELGSPVDMLIVDYADMMRPTRLTEADWANQGRVYQNLRSLAQRYNIAIWTASQGNREGSKARRVGLHHMANSFNKGFPADIILSITRANTDGKEILDDDDDDAEEADDERIVTLLKIRRSGKDNWWLRVHAQFAQARFVQLSSSDDDKSDDDDGPDVPDIEQSQRKRHELMKNAARKGRAS